MYRLMLKNSGFYLLFLAMVVLGMNWYWLDSRTSMDLNVMVMQVTGLFTWMGMSLLNVELVDDRFKGYRFLNTLPLTSKGILAAKLIPNLVATLIYALSSWWLFDRLGGSTDSAVASSRMIAVAIPFVLTLSALIYAAIFRFGFGSVRYLLIALIFIGYLSPIVIVELVLPRTGIGFEEIASGLGGGVFVAILAAGIVLWVASLLAAVKIKEKRYE